MASNLLVILENKNRGIKANSKEIPIRCGPGNLKVLIGHRHVKSTNSHTFAVHRTNSSHLVGGGCARGGSPFSLPTIFIYMYIPIIYTYIYIYIYIYSHYIPIHVHLPFIAQIRHIWWAVTACCDCEGRFCLLTSHRFMSFHSDCTADHHRSTANRVEHVWTKCENNKATGISTRKTKRIPEMLCTLPDGGFSF